MRNKLLLNIDNFFQSDEWLNIDYMEFQPHIDVILTKEMCHLDLILTSKAFDFINSTLSDLQDHWQYKYPEVVELLEKVKLVDDTNFVCIDEPAFEIFKEVTQIGIDFELLLEQDSFDFLLESDIEPEEGHDWLIDLLTCEDCGSLNPQAFLGWESLEQGLFACLVAKKLCVPSPENMVLFNSHKKELIEICQRYR